jgi:hypothetical protein
LSAQVYRESRSADAQKPLVWAFYFGSNLSICIKFFEKKKLQKVSRIVKISVLAKKSLQFFEEKKSQA